MKSATEIQRMDARHVARTSAAILVAAGAAPDAALRIAQLLIDADLAGHPAHGVARIPRYVDAIMNGSLRPGATPLVVRETAAGLVLDGRNGFGELALEQAINAADQIAAEHGVAAVGVRRAHGIGRLSPYVEQLARGGRAALLLANGDARRPVVAPHGGTAARLGANPLAISVPRRSGSLVLDMATCATRTGASAEEAVLSPFGGQSVHKGYGLSLVIELLAGALTGAGCAGQSERPGNGILLLSVDVKQFVTLEFFYDEVEALLEFVRTAGPPGGNQGVWLPGEQEQQRRAAAVRDGVQLDRATWEELLASGRRVGLMSEDAGRESPAGGEPPK